MREGGRERLEGGGKVREGGWEEGERGREGRCEREGGCR